MKPFALFLLLLLPTTQIFSQQLSDSTVAGSWKVVNAKINLKLAPEVTDSMSDKKKLMMEQMRIAFIGAVFNFKSDKEFIITFSGKYPEFTKELEFLNHKEWTINKGDAIAIGTKEDNYSLMKIFAGSKEGKNYFILDETPFVLEVIKE